jgi:hypothetical protein
MREQLEEIESKIEYLSNSQKYMLIASVILVPIIAIFYFLIDPKMDEITTNQDKIIQLDRKISKNSPKKYTALILKKKKDILKDKTTLSELDQKILSTRSKLDSIKYLTLTQEGLTEFVNKLLKNSLKRRVLIKSIEIKEAKQKYYANLKKLRELHINAEGNFLNLSKLLRDIETTQMLMYVSNFYVNISDSSRLDSNITIDFYGVK